MAYVWSHMRSKCVYDLGSPRVHHRTRVHWVAPAHRDVFRDARLPLRRLLDSVRLGDPSAFDRQRQFAAYRLQTLDSGIHEDRTVHAARLAKEKPGRFRPGWKVLGEDA